MKQLCLTRLHHHHQYMKCAWLVKLTGNTEERKNKCGRNSWTFIELTLIAAIKTMQQLVETDSFTQVCETEKEMLCFLSAEIRYKDNIECIPHDKTVCKRCN